MGKLTELKIKQAKPKNKKYKLYDGDYLNLEVYPSGNKQWIYKYKNIKEFKLGNYPALSLKEARLKRDELKKEILLNGLEKVLIKRQESKTKEKRKFESVVNEWLKVYQKDKAKRSVETSIQRINKHLLPAFKGRDIKNIKVKEIYQLLQKQNKPTAEKLKSILNGIFSFALSKEYVEHNIIRDIDLKQIFTTSTKNHYKYNDNLEEFKKYFDEVRDIKSQPIVKGAIKIIFLTALRQGSVRAIKWEHIDFENKILHIPKENLKVKTMDFKIPLVDEAVETFRELKEYKTGDYVFSLNGKKPVSETALRKHLKDISEKHGLKPTSLHGIRHSFSTFTRQYLQREHNIPDEVIEIAMQHIDKNKIRAVYNHYDYLKERRELMELWYRLLTS